MMDSYPFAHEAAAVRKRVCLWLGMAFGLVACAGCSGVHHQVRPFGVEGPWADVRVEWPLSGRIELTGRQLARTKGGRLRFRTVWRNRSSEPCRAELKVTFYDRSGRPEPGSGKWDVHTFAPGGGQVLEWTSYTEEARRCMVVLKARSLWPF